MNNTHRPRTPGPYNKQKDYKTMSALSSQAALNTDTQELAALAILATYPEETRFVIDYRSETINPAPRRNLLVSRRKRSSRRSVR